MNLKLATILNEIIAEVGDLSTTKPYEFRQITPLRFEFVDVEGDTVSVEFQIYDNSLQHLLSPALSNKIGYNVLIKVQDDDVQYKQTSLPLYNRILKTAVDIINIFLKNKKPDFIFVKGNSKEAGDVEVQTVKDSYYMAIIKANTPPTYGYASSKIGGYDGAILRKIK